MAGTENGVHCLYIMDGMNFLYALTLVVVGFDISPPISTHVPRSIDPSLGRTRVPIVYLSLSRSLKDNQGGSYLLLCRT
jgi:hypothetical protein